MVPLALSRPLQFLRVQVSSQIAAGKYSIADEHIPHMTALLAQMEWGNYTEAFVLREKLAEVAAFLPPHVRRDLVTPADQLTSKELFNQSKAVDAFEEVFIKEWKGLNGAQARSLGRTFVAISKSWRFYGASIYEASETASGCVLLAESLHRRPFLLCVTPPEHARALQYSIDGEQLDQWRSDGFGCPCRFCLDHQPKR